MQQAVEFYNGMNNDKYQLYEGRIQSLLVKPEVLRTMSLASQDPELYQKEQEEHQAKQVQMRSLDDREARKIMQIEQDKRKKEKGLKMTQNMEEIKGDSPESKMAHMLDEQENLAEIAEKELKKDQSVQKENLKKRLADRKKKLALKRSLNSS